jgi:hypothetical protein
VEAQVFRTPTPGWTTTFAKLGADGATPCSTFAASTIGAMATAESPVGGLLGRRRSRWRVPPTSAARRAARITATEFARGAHDVA